MTFAIQRQDRDSNQALIRRFTKRLKASGILIKVRKSTFYGRAKSPQMKKKAALRKIEKRQEYDALVKLGKKNERTAPKRG
jgi:ribosomal protein S21